MTELTYEDVVVNVNTNVGSTATVGGANDYTLSSVPVTITQGTTLQTVTVTVNDDGDIEPTETVILDLAGISGGGASLNGDLQHTFAIQDNDASAFTWTGNAGNNTWSDGELSSGYLRTGYVCKHG